MINFINTMSLNQTTRPFIYPNIQLMRNNCWVNAMNEMTLPVFNPANEVAIAHVAHASIGDLDKAIHAAEIGFEIWKHISAVERGKLMRQSAALLRQRVDFIAEILTQEQGKPVLESKAEIMVAAEVIEFMSDEGRRVYGRTIAARVPNIQNMALKTPIGIVAAFTPWNFPINQIARKLSAALAAGCSIIIKGPEETPASPAAFIQCFIDAGIPPGVIGLVYGNPSEISQYLIAHNSIRMITFTGSTIVGKQLASLAGQYMKPCLMELGGHAPVIVAKDADIFNTVKSIIAAKFRNAGQACIAPSRFLIHHGIKSDFNAELLKNIKQIVIGDGLNHTTTLGPLANKRRVIAMQSLIDNAVQSGATLLAGGQCIGSVGNFFTPTVLDEVPTTADVFNTEPFGPIIAMQTFDQLDEAIKEANRLAYGLAAYAYTQSLNTAYRLFNEINSGMLWINQGASAWPELPFGGIKDSGYGSEGGSEALIPYLNTRMVSIAF